MRYAIYARIYYAAAWLNPIKISEPFISEKEALTVCNEMNKIADPKVILFEVRPYMHLQYSYQG